MPAADTHYFARLFQQAAHNVSNVVDDIGRTSVVAVALP
jgi:hypothetical protein